MIVNRKIIKDTRYLYDIDPCFLATLQYKDALEYKVIKGKELLNELVRIKNEAYTQRVDDVKEAIEFNEALLEELRC